MRKLILGTAAVFMVAGGAIAGPAWWDDPRASAGAPIAIPAHDVDRACRETFGRGTNSAYSISNCIETEQAAYDGLKAIWADAPESAKRQAVGDLRGEQAMTNFAGYYAGLQDVLSQYTELYRTIHPAENRFKP